MPVYEYKLKKKNPVYNNFTWYYYSGKYTDYFGNAKEYKKRGFNKKTDAKRSENEFLSKVRDSTTQSINQNLSEVISEYLQYSSTFKRKNSIRIDERRCHAQILPYFGNKKPASITPKDISKWHQSMLEKGLSHQYVLTIHKTLNKMYTYLDQMYHFNYNPLKRVKVPKDTGMKKEMETWTLDDFHKFISFIDDLRINTLFRVFFFGGFRRGEVLAFKWKNFDGNKLTVKASISCAVGGWELGPPKTDNSYRSVIMDDVTVEQLNAMHNQAKNVIGYNAEAFIFGSPERPMAVNTPYNNLVEYTKSSEVKKIRLHDLRHSHATILVAQGKSIKAVASRLGDTVKTVLDTYVHDEEESMLDLANTVNDLSKKYAKSMPKL